MLSDEIKNLKGPIAVFGAGGFVGANLFNRLFSERSDVLAITQQNFAPWRLTDVPQKNIIQADITSSSQIENLFNIYRFKSIFVFSAYGAYSRQVESSRIYQTNLIGLLNIISAAEKHGFNSLVHAGSSSEYGENCAGPLENSELKPNSHYAVSKVSAAYLIQFYGKIKKLPVVNLRLYSIYGPLEEEDRLIPKIVSAGLIRKFPPLVGPQISRDFLYIDDCVDATILSAKYAVELVPGDSLNLATGTKTSLLELAHVSKKIFDIPENPEFGTMPNRSWDLDNWYGDAQKARQVLNWEPKVSLEAGLRATANWIKNNGPGPIVTEIKQLQKIPRLTAVIACYKDGMAIPFMHKRLTETFQRLRVDYEIIFVNDQSPDNSNEVLKEICSHDPKVIAIEHSRNFGSQGAFLSGMGVSTGDAVVLLDGDLQDPPELIEQFFKEWKKGFEVVYGRRVKREAKLLQNFFYKCFYRVFKKVANIPIPLDAGDFSMIDRKVVNEMLLLPESDQFLRGLRAWVGFKQIGVDYIRPERMFGVSTNNLRKNFWWARKAIFSFSFVPIETLIYLGLATTASSFLGLLWQVFSKFYFPGTPQGVSTIIVLVLFFGGVQLLAVSVIGEYVGKIVEECKNRPKFIRRSIRNGLEYLDSSEQIKRFVAKRHSSNFES